MLAWLSRTLPTWLVLAALSSLAYWGHQNGWKLPKFSSLNGSAAAEKDDWCKEHSVPESQCVECRLELFPKAKDYGWCKQHGVHNCPLDHPDVAQLAVIPPITQADFERVRQALATKERPENNSKCPLYRRRIQFVSAAALAKAGVDIALVEERSMVEFVAAHGEITYDQTRVARLATPLPGIVWRVAKAKGDRVPEGDVLLLVSAVKVGEAKAEFLQAVTEVDLEKKTLARLEALQGRIVAGKEIPEAEARLRKAQVRLVTAQQALVNLGLPIQAEDVKDLPAENLARYIQFLGLPETITRTLDPRTTTANLIPIRAPFGGIVVERDAVASDVVETTKPLFVVADTSQMWLTLHVRQEEAKHLALGQTVRFRADGGAAEATGKITLIDTAVDEKTRTVKARADLANPDGRLRASTFGTGRIVLREEPNGLAVPSEAVHWDGSCHVVFVRDKDFLKDGAPKVFHTRTVRSGAKDDKYTEIIAGVLPGEVVAAKGSGILRAELLKNNLGAG
ncbi:MAG: efflux RND transporter periplasmic adaptor subunit [Gemmataceae bacterium]|nr:efflux RND transporter periplasmic adaptor subunit [Gemmataceae bacterium]